jgi:hypothetical protein
MSRISCFTYAQRERWYAVTNQQGKLTGDSMPKGTFKFADGAVYEGDWIDGKYHGTGKFSFGNGDVYEGGFRNGKYHGTGKLTYADGTVQEGTFIEDVFQG